jgi:hypothetical protein
MSPLRRPKVWICIVVGIVLGCAVGFARDLGVAVARVGDNMGLLQAASMFEESNDMLHPSALVDLPPPLTAVRQQLTQLNIQRMRDGNLTNYAQDILIILQRELEAFGQLLNKTHAEDVGELARAVSFVSSCNAAANVSGMGVMRDNTEMLGAMHVDCRQDEIEMKNSMEISCSRFFEAAKSFAVKIQSLTVGTGEPQRLVEEADESFDLHESMFSKYDQSLGFWSTAIDQVPPLQRQCEGHMQQYSSHVARCKRIQSDLESETCAWHMRAADSCPALDSCWEESTARLNITWESVQVAASARAEQAIVAAQLKCIVLKLQTGEDYNFTEACAYEVPRVNYTLDHPVLESKDNCDSFRPGPTNPIPGTIGWLHHTLLAGNASFYMSVTNEPLAGSRLGADMSSCPVPVSVIDGAKCSANPCDKNNHRLACVKPGVQPRTNSTGEEATCYDHHYQWSWVSCRHGFTKCWTW